MSVIPSNWWSKNLHFCHLGFFLKKMDKLVKIYYLHNLQPPKMVYFDKPWNTKIAEIANRKLFFRFVDFDAMSL